MSFGINWLLGHTAHHVVLSLCAARHYGAVLPSGSTRKGKRQQQQPGRYARAMSERVQLFSIPCRTSVSCLFHHLYSHSGSEGERQRKRKEKRRLLLTGRCQCCDRVTIWLEFDKLQRQREERWIEVREVVDWGKKGVRDKGRWREI